MLDMGWADTKRAANDKGLDIGDIWGPDARATLSFWSNFSMRRRKEELVYEKGLRIKFKVMRVYPTVIRIYCRTGWYKTVQKFKQDLLKSHI